MNSSRSTHRHMLASVMVIGLAAHASLATEYIWNSTTGGNWSDTSASGWNSAGYPNVSGDAATINQNIVANQIMNLDVSATVGALTLGDLSGTSTWTVQDTGSLGTVLAFDVTNGVASLTKTAGGVVSIKTPIQLNDPLAVTNTGNSTSFNLHGAISGTGDITATGVQNSSFAPITIGSGTSDTAVNTYVGTFTWNGGPPSTTSTFLDLNKAAGTTAITGDFFVNGKVVFRASNLIADSANITVGSNGQIVLSDMVETVNGITVNAGGEFKGTGSSGSSTTTATSFTRLNGGLWQLVGRGGRWATGTLTINGGTNIMSATSGNDGELLTVTGVTTINQPASGAFTAFSMASSSTKSAIFAMLGGLTFTGNVANASSVSMTDSDDANTGTTEIRLTNVAGAQNRTFNIGDGGAVVDLIIGTKIVNGTASGSGIIKTGAGTLALGGKSTYTGTTAVDNGTLLIDGTTTGQGNFTVASGSTLGGRGTIGLAANKTVTVSGSLRPGLPGEGGNLTVTSSGSPNGVVFGANSALAIDISGQTNGVLTVNGNLNLSSGSAMLTIQGVPSGPAAVRTLVSYTGTRTGDFATLIGVPDHYSLAYDFEDTKTIVLVPIRPTCIIIQ